MRLALLTMYRSKKAAEERGEAPILGEQVQETLCDPGLLAHCLDRLHENRAHLMVDPSHKLKFRRDRPAGRCKFR